MFDILDMEKPVDENYLEGNYYVRKPKTLTDHAVIFTYAMIDPSTKDYGKIMGNLRADMSSCAIRTNDDCGWRVNGYVVTQDGEFWQIEGVRKDIQNEDNKEALRVVVQPANTDFVLRLIAVENPWELS